MLTPFPSCFSSLVTTSLFSTSMSLFPFCYIHLFVLFFRRRKWQLTPVFLPGESQGQRSLVSHNPQGRKESDTTEATARTCTYSFSDSKSKGYRLIVLWFSLIYRVNSLTKRSNYKGKIQYLKWKTSYEAKIAD